MKSYAFYSIIDDGKEFIKTIKAPDMEEATVLFSQIKNLSIDDFISIYKVIQLL